VKTFPPVTGSGYAAVMDGTPEQIGPYQVVREIGRGGMGVVYLGHDAKLDRPVAIKALSEDVAGGPEHLGRFEREARVLASLSHGNIATVYGFEESGGEHFIVMEFVEGHTLADRLADGPLPVNEALTITAQIAAGVEAAHDAGVVHRDLKPGNVIIRPDGTPKVLDFGLARELPSRSSQSELREAPTLPRSFTREGVSIGTPGYMSPEQVRGMTVDRRTDVFAFGCILYECLTGQLAFAGATTHDSIAAILEREPDWTTLPPGTPPTVQLLLRRMLQKDRRRRLRDIGDARIEIEQAIEDPTSTSLGLAGLALAAGRTTGRGSRLPWALVALFALVAAAATWLALRPEAPVRRPVSRFTVTLPEGMGIRPDWTFKSIDLSSDGRTLVLMGVGDPWSDLYLRPLDQLEPLLMPNTSGGASPVFSPDGEWVAFLRDDEIQRVSVRGGPASTVCDLSGQQLRGMDWAPDGSIVFGTSSGGLKRVRAAGGAVEELTVVEEGSSVSHRQPAVLPGDRGVLFAAFGPSDSYGSVMVMSPALAEPRTLVTGGKSPVYAQTGHLLFYREGTLMAAPFDLERLELIGPAVPTEQEVGSTRDRAGAQYTLSSTGTLAFLSGTASGTNELVRVSREGVEEPISDRPGSYRGVQLSPDGRQAAVIIGADQGAGSDPFSPGELWILDVDRDVPRRITRGDHERAPTWHPDGRSVVVSSKRHGDVFNLYRYAIDGSGEPERLAPSEGRQLSPDWSSDGRLLAFEEAGDIMLLRLDETGALSGPPEPLAASPDARERVPQFSPDGRWLAYISNEADTSDLYVRPVSGGATPVRITTRSTWAPIWSPNEDVLYFCDGTGQQAVDYEVVDDAFRPGDPREVFSYGTAGPTHFVYGYDEQREAFLAVTLPGLALADPQVTFVLDWFSELEAKASSPGG
jgi:serine/threonine-protein kinase